MLPRIIALLMLFPALSLGAEVIFTEAEQAEQVGEQGPMGPPGVQGEKGDEGERGQRGAAGTRIVPLEGICYIDVANEEHSWPCPKTGTVPPIVCPGDPECPPEPPMECPGDPDCPPEPPVCPGDPECPPTGERNLRGHLTFETGKIQKNGNKVDGLFTDGLFVTVIYPDGEPRTIVNVTNSTTPVVTYTGAKLSNGDGITFTGVEGMIELEGRLFRAKNATSSTFHLWQDGDDSGYNQAQSTEGNTRTNTSGYGTWSGTAKGQTWKSFSNGDGNPRIPLDADVRVVSGSVRPPANSLGQANLVSPLGGQHFLSTDVWYWKANDVGSGNSNLNKPRWHGGIGNGADFAAGDEEWFSASLHLASNYDHTTFSGTGSRSDLIFAQVPGSSSNGMLVKIVSAGRSGSGGDHYELDYRRNGGTTSKVDLGSMAEDIGRWTTFVIRVKAHSSQGVLQIWKSTGPYISGQERAMKQVFSATNINTSFNAPNGINWNIRQYKFGWHHNRNGPKPPAIWAGWDEIRFGGENEDTGFRDVHPFQQSEP